MVYDSKTSLEKLSSTPELMALRNKAQFLMAHCRVSINSVDFNICDAESCHHCTKVRQKWRDVKHLYAMALVRGPHFASIGFNEDQPGTLLTSDRDKTKMLCSKLTDKNFKSLLACKLPLSTWIYNSIPMAVPHGFT